MASKDAGEMRSRAECRRRVVVEGLEVVKTANLTPCRFEEAARLPVKKRDGTTTLCAALEVATGKGALRHQAW